MVFFTICGKPDCCNFAHATYVAQYLHEHLPDFKYKKIEKTNCCWPDFVAGLNKRFKWYMVKSPIIWKEISDWGGKPYLIGGLNEFWEYVYCYYGLESRIPKEDLQKLADDNVKFFKEEEEKTSKDNLKYDVSIGIVGVGPGFLIEELLGEFFSIPYFRKHRGFFVKVYEESYDDPTWYRERIKLDDIVEYFNNLSYFGNRQVVSIVDSEDDVVEKTDLLLFFEDYSRKQEEDMLNWTKRCQTRIAVLSDAINIKGKRPLKVIFCNEGPTCFMATCMLEYCTVLIPSNIVALSADRGLPVISAISRITGVKTSMISAPVVWGFIGINEYVDEANILFKAHIYRPYQRSLTTPVGSTLPLGSVVPELRLMSYMVPDQHDEIIRIVEERKAAVEARLHRKPFLPKLIALKSLLLIWYAEEIPDDVISLGVCSNGNYGIPPGVIFSQPCILDRRRRWNPYPNFPITNETTQNNVKILVDETVNVLQEMFILKHPISESDNDESFDYDEIPFGFKKII